jgi:signal transduction histidine kinase/CheY-like chemotaxis protein
MAARAVSLSPLRVLLAEDSADDALLIELELKRYQLPAEVHRVDNPEAMEAALEAQPWDIVLSDHAMPQFSSMQVVELLKTRGAKIPCIIVSGAIGEEAAVALMREGAADYVNKDKLSLLGPAVQRALAAAAEQRARREAEEALKRAHDELEQRVAERTAELSSANRKLHQEIRERVRAEAALRYREAILEAASFAAERFLRQPSWSSDINEVLRCLGEATSVSRVYIFENVPHNGEVVARMRYEWLAPGSGARRKGTAHLALDYRKRGLSRWRDCLAAGKELYGFSDDFPADEQGLLKEQGILALALVPVFVGERWWGFLGLDDYRLSRHWSELEIDALRVVADTLGAAIERREREHELEEVRLHLAESREAERQHVARELHDGAVQQLIGISYELSATKRALERAGVAAEMVARLGEHRSKVLAVVDQLRQVIGNLRPAGLLELGMRASLENYVNYLRDSYPHTCPAFELEIVANEQAWTQEVSLCLYRVAQEALRNAVKHAKAARVALRVEEDDGMLLLRVVDDGVGFVVPERLSVLARDDHFGLIGIHEYVSLVRGELLLRSRTGEGTEVTVKIPLAAGQSHAE